MQTSVLTVYREPFGFAPSVRYFRPGVSLDAMRGAFDLPEDFGETGTICIDGQPVPRALWGLVKPKAAATCVTFHAGLHGGGGDGGKNALAIVAGIGLSIVTGGIASGAILGGLTNAAITGANIASIALAAGVSYAGSLLISSLIPPPSSSSFTTPDAPGAASAQGNVLSPNAAVPRVVGRRKAFPPLAMEPLIYFEGADEVVEAVYILDGPHDLTDVRIGGVEAASLEGVYIETREGWDDDDPLSIGRYARTVQIGQDLRRQVTGTDPLHLADDTAASLPLPMTFVTRSAPDLHEIQMVLPSGLFDTEDGTGMFRIPFRIEMRPVGASGWVRFPEVHYQSETPGQKRLTLRFDFTGAIPPITVPPLDDSEGFHVSLYSVPAQTVAPMVGGWDADAVFVGTGAPNYAVYEIDRLRFRLDPDDFPPDRYEIRITRGHAFALSGFDPATYEIGGQVYDFFGYYDDGPDRVIIEDLSRVADVVHVLRSVSIWNDPPLPQPGFAAIFVRARNVSLGAVSVMAGGYVRDWGGSGWDDWVVTSNPAPHLRDIMVGDLNRDPVPVDALDEQSFLDFRAHCTAMGYEVNAVIEDKSIADAARIVASCGYGSPYMSDVWGVIWDRDRSADAPTQIFSNRNSRDFSFSKAFARVPDAFLVNFDSAALEYDPDQILISYDGASDRVEQVAYEGLVTDAEITNKAVYDQAQARFRSTFYSLTCAAEHLISRRGDLVGVARDILDAHKAAARVLAAETDTGGDVIAVTVDAPLPVSADMSDQGVMFVAAGGSETVAYTSGDGFVLTLDSPVSPDIAYPGGLVAAGPLGSEVRRLIIQDVTPRVGYTATLTLVDEAPGIWAEMASRSL